MSNPSLSTETYLTALAATPVAPGAPSHTEVVALWFARLAVVDPDLCRSLSGDPELEAEQAAFLAAHGWTVANYDAHTAFETVCSHKAAFGE